MPMCLYDSLAHYSDLDIKMIVTNNIMWHGTMAYDVRKPRTLYTRIYTTHFIYIYNI